MDKTRKKQDWRSCDLNLSTSTNIRKYLELCKQWLVENDMENNSQPVPFSNIPPDPYPIEEPCIGMHEIELRHGSEFECVICKTPSNLKEDGKVMVANPFTRAQFMPICNTCCTSINNK